MSGVSHGILVSFFSDHRTGCCSSGFFKYRRDSSRDRKNAVRGIPGLVPRFAVFEPTSNLRPVNVRVAPLTTRRHSNHVNSQKYVIPKMKGNKL